jgi:cytoskeletal protein CcmA (bactofilin family)
MTMALWKEPNAATPPPKEPTGRTPEMSTITPLNPDLPRRTPERADAKESLIASDLTIEGKIEGAGHVRIAGSFKGDVHVHGNLTIDPGARLTGQVRANTVVVGGELNGNIEAALRVELLATGVVSGDVKAGSLVVSAGSRMRGQVEFGWEEKGAKPLAGAVTGKVDSAFS